MNVRITNYGLKEGYNFKETHISTGHDPEEVQNNILTHIAPAITELESQELINGFHFILHKEIDLRISSENWNTHEEQIKRILRRNNISEHLSGWSMSDPENYGGSSGIILCYNNLEFNSRLILSVLDISRQENNPDIRKLYGQWVHYLYIQCGFGNEKEMALSFNSALGWANRLIDNNQFMSNVHNRDTMLNMLNQMENYIRQLRSRMENN